jgi:hypothetical protein
MFARVNRFMTPSVPIRATLTAFELRLDEASISKNGRLAAGFTVNLPQGTLLEPPPLPCLQHARKHLALFSLRSLALAFGGLVALLGLWSAAGSVG